MGLNRVPFSLVRLSMIGKADADLLKEEREAAVAVLRDLLHRPKVAPRVPGLPGVECLYSNRDRLADLERLIAIAPRLDVTPEVATYLDNVTRVREISVSTYAPKNDVLYPIQAGRLPPPKGQKPPGNKFKGAERYREFLLETTGQAPQEKIDAVNLQLASGGPLRPFVTSGFSQEVAKRISANAPLGAYMKPLLNGEYRTAAQLAWRQARLTTDVDVRDNWLVGVAVAVGCQEQCCAGRAAAFMNWVHPDTYDAKAKGAMPPDPLTDYLGLPDLPFQPTAAETAAAAAYLDKLTDATWLDNPTLLRILPGDDVMVAATGCDRVYGSYMAWLWRTTGRFTAAQLAPVKRQMEHGGKERPFVVSEESKKLAAQVSSTAPFAEYLKLLLSGQHQAAARLAWKKALAAQQKKNTGLFRRWVPAVVIAVRGYDQTRDGRAADFLKWTRGQLLGPDGKPVTANPLAQFLGDPKPGAPGED